MPKTEYTRLFSHVENFWGIVSPEHQQSIVSPVEILPVQKHKNY